MQSAFGGIRHVTGGHLDKAFKGGVNRFKIQVA
jgi:hypothetical protein